MSRRQQDQLSKLIDELSIIVQSIFTISTTTTTTTSSIEYPHDTPQSISAVATRGSSSTAASGQRDRRRSVLCYEQITPSDSASLLLGVSVVLMIAGSLTFFLGFMLMPWILAAIFLIYVVGVVSSLWMLGRAIFCPNSTPSSPKKELSFWKVL